jgi:protease YdgD
MSRKSQVMASGLSGVVVFSHLMIASAHLRPNPVEDSQTPANASMHRITDPAIFNLKETGEPFFPPGLERSDNPFPFRAIVGRDDRVPMVSRQFPWSAIGRIEGVTADGKRYSCTGTLIAKNIVLTNAHCVINPNTQTVSRIIQFKPNLINGALQDDADVGVVESYYYGTDFKANKTSTDADDWAVLKLDKPLGEKYGFLGWRAPSAPEFAQKSNRLALVGYSADFPQNPKTYGGLELTAGPGLTAGVHQGCSVVGEQAGLLLHDCDTKGGASGGPILAKIGSKHYIVALHAGWRKVDGNVVNYAVKMSQIQAWLNRDSSLRKMGKPG